jgi:hypothetical protein
MVVTDTKPANCSPLFRWDHGNASLFSHRKKYYEDVGLILSYTVSFKDSNNQICSKNTANMRSMTITFANRESCLKWNNDAVRKTYSSENLKYYKIYVSLDGFAILSMFYIF